jgi:hypothetical protein
MGAPGGELFPAYLSVFGATERGDRTAKWFPMLVCVALTNGKISPQKRKIHLHELWILQDLFGRASQASNLGEDLLIRQLVKLNLSVWKSWRSVSRYDHMNGARDALGTQPAGKLETYQCAHAVAEECIWSSEQGGEHRSQRF